MRFQITATLFTGMLATVLAAVDPSADPTQAPSAAARLVGAVKAAPDAMDTMLTEAISAEPGEAPNLVAAAVEAFPGRTEEIARVSVVALAKAVPADQLSASIVKVLEGVRAGLVKAGLSEKDRKRIFATAIRAAAAAAPPGVDIGVAVASPTASGTSGSLANPAIPALVETPPIASPSRP